MEEEGAFGREKFTGMMGMGGQMWHKAAAGAAFIGGRSGDGDGDVIMTF
jgi:hypothetical protein